MPDWPLIRHAYEAGDVPVRQLCEGFAINPSALYRRAKLERWKKRSSIKTAKPKSTMPKEPQNKTLVDRLYAAFETQMAEFEARLKIAPEDALSEKEARTLGSLARTLEKLIELRADNKISGVAAETSEINIEQLLEDISRRLAKVRGGGAAS